MRAVWVALLLLASGIVSAQVPSNSRWIGDSLRLRFPKGVEPGRVGAPLEPKQGEPLPAADGRLPAPQAGTTKAFQLIGAKSVRSAGDMVYLSGDAHFLYSGYEVFADEVEGNRRTRVFTIKGHARLIGEDVFVEGESLEVDFANETFRSIDGTAELRPNLLQKKTLDNVYVKSKETFGSEKEVIAFGSQCTTCNKKSPHFHIAARKMTIRPGKRVIFRDARWVVLGKTILGLPYLSIPIDERQERYTPEFGQSPDQGYYVKSKWGLAATDTTYLESYLDYFTKLGFGVGGRYDYSTDKLNGYLRAYGLTGNTNSTEVTTSHSQDFGRSKFLLETNYQKQNLLNAPENTTLAARASLDVPSRFGSTRLTFASHTNDGQAFSSSQQTIGVSDLRDFGNKTKTSIDVRYAKSESSFSTGGNQRSQIEVRLRGEKDLRSFRAELEYQRSVPVGDTTNFFRSAERTPVLTLRSDSARLFGGQFRNVLPFQTELSIGEFSDAGAENRLTRTLFDFTFNRPDVRRARSGLGIGGRFRQSVYSDDTAQYVLGLNGNYRYSVGPRTGLNVRYSYVEPNGFTPLSIDRIGRTNSVSGDLSYEFSPKLLIGAQTGYDFLIEQRGERSPWQSIGARIEWNPSDWFNLRALPIYDPERAKWSNVRIDATYALGDKFINVGARYDGLRQVWGNVNLYADGLKWGRTRAGVLLNYNGFINKFESKQFVLTYDLHCAEAVMQIVENNFGFRPGREVYFFIRLKAFPQDSFFGTGRRGQPLGTGTGSGY